VGNALAIKITADVTNAQAELVKMRAELSATTSEVNKLGKAWVAGNLDSAGMARMEGLAQQAVTLKGNIQGLTASMRSVQSASGGVGGALDDIRGKMSAAFQFTGIAAAAAAIGMVGSKLVELGGRAAEMRATADVLGVTVEQYQAMSAAADTAGVSTEALTRTAERLVGMLQQARNGSGEAVEKLKALGISNQQIASSTFGANDALGVLHARLTDASSAQAEQNQLLAEFGPRGAEAIVVLKQYSGSAAEVAARMRELNGLSTDDAASAAGMYASYREFGSYLANTFTKALDATTQGLARAAEVLLATPASSPALQATVQAPSIAPKVQADAAQAQAAMTEISVTAHKVTQDQLNDMREVVAATQQGSAERLAAERSLYQAMQAFYGNDQVDKVRAQYRELQAATQAYAEAQVRAENEVTAAMQRSAAIKKQSIAEELADSQKYLDQQSAIARVDAESAIAINRMKLQAELDELNSEVAAHKMSAAQKFAIEKGLVTQLAELDKQQAENEVAAQEPGTEAYERAADKIKEIEARLQVDLAQLQGRFVQESGKAAQQDVNEWKKASDEILSAETSLTSDLLSRRKSLSQSLLQIGAQMVQQEIANDLRAVTQRIVLQEGLTSTTKGLEQGGYLFHLLMETMKTGVDTTQNAARTAAAGTAAAQQNAETAAAAATARGAAVAAGVAQIGTDAAVAAAGAAASVASIPLVGWAMAPGAAAAAYGQTMAYAGLASLAEGAWEIPQSGLYHLHEGEAVAPVPYARGMREAAASPSAGTGRGSATTGESAGGGDTHLHIGLSAWDGDSVGRWASRPDNQRQLTRAVLSHLNRVGYRRT
jgi:hypothetical protein